MVPYLKCMLVVAATTGLPPRVLPVIQAIEGGSPGLTRPDPNGTADLGVMQINTIWVSTLANRAGLSEARTRESLIEDPCFNIAAAALILRAYIAESDGNILTAIGDYHSHNPIRRGAYIELAERKANTLFEVVNH